MLDFETLRIIWWLLLGVLLIGFAILGGIDLGVATLLPYVSKQDIERRIVLNTIAPTWEGNQVWFILGGGAIFAAWPTVYAVTFSNFYFALLLILIALILRPVGLDFRSKIECPVWRKSWDIAINISGIVPSLVFGVAVGNVLQGIDFDLDEFMFIKNSTGFWALFSPFTLLCGVTSLSMIVSQGAAFLVLKTEADIQNRAKTILKITPILTLLLFIIGGWCISKMNGFSIIGDLAHDASSDPHGKLVKMYPGAWLENYSKTPWFLTAPILGASGAIMTWILSLLRKYSLVIITNSLSILGIISTVGLSMFPFILPSKINYTASLTVWDASSSQTSLFIMLLAVIIFMPIILFYTSWAYKIMFGKVTEKNIKSKPHEVY